MPDPHPLLRPQRGPGFAAPAPRFTLQHLHFFRVEMPQPHAFSLIASLFARVSRQVPQWLCVGLLTSCSASSCQSSRAAQSAPLYFHGAPPRLEQYVSLHRNLVFYDSAASSDVTVFFDRAPGFLVADQGQTELRAYSDAARLLWSAGRKGNGPSEFQVVIAAVRNSAGEVIALDDAGKVVIFNSSREFIRSARTELGPAYGMVLLNDSTLLISGRNLRDPRNQDQPLLHVWDLRRNRITNSFSSVPPHNPRLEEGYRYSGWATATLLSGDTLGILFPLSDTLYRYRTNGTPIDKRRLSLRTFHRLRDPAPTNASTQETVRWRNSYTRLSDIFAAPDGSVYVQFFNMRELEPIFGVARFTFTNRGLKKSFEVPEAPRLLGISPRDSTLYFLQPDLNPERVTWSVGRYSP